MNVRGFYTIASMIVAFAAGPGLAHADERSMTRIAQDKQSTCLCRGNGAFFEEGQVTCLRTTDGPRLATCGMVLNIMSWKFSDRPCPNS